jgi:hypothetical protein
MGGWWLAVETGEPRRAPPPGSVADREGRNSLHPGRRRLIADRTLFDRRSNRVSSPMTPCWVSSAVPPRRWQRRSIVPRSSRRGGDARDERLGPPDAAATPETNALVVPTRRQRRRRTLWSSRRGGNAGDERFSPPDAAAAPETNALVLPRRRQRRRRTL